MDMMLSAYQLVFAGYGIPMTANSDLAALSMFTTEEMSEFLPLGLKRLRGIRVGTLTEIPRI